MRKLKIANSREYNIKMTYYLVTIQTIVCLTGMIFQIPKWRVPRLLKSEELSLTGQGLLRFIELKTFRSVTGYSISIVNISKQDDGSITGEILHRLDYPSVYNSQQALLTFLWHFPNFHQRIRNKPTIFR